MTAGAFAAATGGSGAETAGEHVGPSNSLALADANGDPTTEHGQERRCQAWAVAPDFSSCMLFGHANANEAGGNEEGSSLDASWVDNPLASAGRRDSDCRDSLGCGYFRQGGLHNHLAQKAPYPVGFGFF